MLHVTSSLHDVFRGDFEGCWAVFLFEAASEVALMVVLPLEHTRDLVHEFGGLDALASLVHGSLVTALVRRVVVVIEQTTSSVAGLVGTSTAHNIKNKGIARYFLVHLDLDDIATLDLGPIRDDKLARPFVNHKPLYWLIIDLVTCFSQFGIGKTVHQACAKEADRGDGDYVRVLLETFDAGRILEE